jgi:Mlc titration factor MtfA (ptsG expression regulator)
MEALAIPAVVGAVLLLCLFAGWALVRRWRPPASTAPSVRAPEQWRALLEDRVPLVRRLAPGEWDRLFELVQMFLREKHFEGGGGLEVTDEMKIIVAAQACLLILHLEAGCTSA